MTVTTLRRALKKRGQDVRASFYKPFSSVCRRPRPAVQYFAADVINSPPSFVAGGNDPRVPLNEAEQMVRTVRKNGSPVWYLMAKDEGHGFAKKKNQDFQFYATVMFIREYLLK